MYKIFAQKEFDEYVQSPNKVKKVSFISHRKNTLLKATAGSK